MIWVSSMIVASLVVDAIVSLVLYAAWRWIFGPMVARWLDRRIDARLDAHFGQAASGHLRRVA